MDQRQNQATAGTRNTRRIAFVQACWHKDIVDRCHVSFTAEIAKHGFGEGDIDFFEVPRRRRLVPQRSSACCRCPDLHGQAQG
jgi:6,7-dimethyl-8-ribityllumazine synthase